MKNLLLWNILASNVFFFFSSFGCHCLLSSPSATNNQRQRKYEMKKNERKTSWIFHVACYFIKKFFFSYMFQNIQSMFALNLYFYTERFCWKSQQHINVKNNKLETIQLNGIRLSRLHIYTYTYAIIWLVVVLHLIWCSNILLNTHENRNYFASFRPVTNSLY